MPLSLRGIEPRQGVAVVLPASPHLDRLGGDQTALTCGPDVALDRGQAEARTSRQPSFRRERIGHVLRQFDQQSMDAEPEPRADGVGSLQLPGRPQRCCDLASACSVVIGQSASFRGEFGLPRLVARPGRSHVQSKFIDLLVQANEPKYFTAASS